ncbi:MAG TPA: M20/M25/M40 family metallo-hydrolase [Terriglobales bacterium]|jgi:acetylornithine deacetylase/succinyl-diaminopimelate desuccinylase-like protein|nr:M20/M25/M40 family metallo-hydrolase [Terriglobales bacterium]
MTKLTSMALSPRAEVSEVFPNVQQEVARLAVLAEVRSAFAWLRAREAQFAHWQVELARIAAPPFAEAARATWLAEKFRELGLDNVHSDDVGNVFGIHPGFGKTYVALSAHLDTVFPAGTPLNIRQQGGRLYGPGVSDNAAGVTAMLAIAALLQAVRVRHALPLLFIGNVGEEGEGDLRGMRHIFSTPRWRESILYSVVLDGAGSDTIVAEALGSRRFEVIVRGPGGHSWSDFGAPNPILVLARAIHSFGQTPVPSSPKTTFNIGVIRGGTSVNSIPESASMRVDIRSTSTAEMERLESALRLALDRAMEEETLVAEARAPLQQRRPFGLSTEVVAIGNRPAGELDPNARILQVIRAVDAQLGNSAQVQRASTDANIPLSLGREAIAIGGGGIGGGAHTLQEWFDCGGRELGLKRILLTLLALAGVNA